MLRDRSRSSTCPTCPRADLASAKELDDVAMFSKLEQKMSSFSNRVFKREHISYYSNEDVARVGVDWISLNCILVNQCME